MHVLAIDAGTTGITALVLDGPRHIVGTAYAEFPQSYPRPGWVEHDPVAIEKAALRVAKAACRQAKLQPRRLAAIGITNQRETTVVWDAKTGKPVHPAIVWQDRRTAERCDDRTTAKLVRRKTGLRLDPYFSGTKVEWILDNVAGARRRAEAGDLLFGTIDTWLAWRLTGEHVTDPTNASRTMLWDIHRSTYDRALLEAFRVPAAMLPEVRPSSEVIAPVKALGGAPLAALVGDQQAALFGQHCLEAGEAKNTYGTGCFMLQHTGADAVASKHGLLTTRAASLDAKPRYALEGSVFIGGAVVQWLRDGLKIIDSAAAVNERAAEAEDTGGVVVVPAFAGLGAPHWDPAARGAILGITRGTSRRHVARAALESIAFQSADLVAAMEADSRKAIPALKVDGGATQSDLLMQFQADLLGRPVVRPSAVESTALGAAGLAGLAVDAWRLDDLRPEEAKVFKPRRRNDLEAKRAAWQAAVDAVRRFKPA